MARRGNNDEVDEDAGPAVREVVEVVEEPVLDLYLPAFANLQFPLPGDADRINADLTRWLGADNVPDDNFQKQTAWLENACQRVVLLWWEPGPGAGDTKRPKSKLYYIPLSDFYAPRYEDVSRKYQTRLDVWGDNPKLNFGYTLTTGPRDQRKMPVYNSMPFGEKMLSNRYDQHIDATNTAKQFFVSGPIADANQRGGFQLHGSKLNAFNAGRSVKLNLARDAEGKITHVGGISIGTLALVHNLNEEDIEADAIDEQKFAKSIYVVLVKDACNNVGNGSMCAIEGKRNREEIKVAQASGIRNQITEYAITLGAMLSLAKKNTEQNWQDALGAESPLNSKLDDLYFTEEILQPFWDFIRPDIETTRNAGNDFLTDIGWDQNDTTVEEENV